MNPMSVKKTEIINFWQCQRRFTMKKTIITLLFVLFLIPAVAISSSQILRLDKNNSSGEVEYILLLKHDSLFEKWFEHSMPTPDSHILSWTIKSFHPTFYSNYLSFTQDGKEFVPSIFSGDNFIVLKGDLDQLEPDLLANGYLILPPYFDLLEPIEVRLGNNKVIEVLLEN